MDKAINDLTPEQRQAIMMRAQQEANQQVMQEMLEKMVASCFSKCAGTSVSCYNRFYRPMCGRDSSKS
jgi:DNA-directed RNA polymerase specialized sigma24 family protein